MRRVLPLVAALLVAAGAPGQAPAQEAAPARWPAPPDGWWRALDAGERATFELRQGQRAVTRRVMCVERVEGSRVTVSFEQTEGDAAPCRMAATVDVSDAADVGDVSLPAGARFKKVRTEKLKVGTRELECDVYELVLDGPLGLVSMTAWHCPRLPPVFMGGVVKLESRVAGIEASIALVDYQGELLP